MPIKFEDIDMAFDFVSSGAVCEHEAYLDRDSGKIYWYSDIGDNEEELPSDLDDPKYISIPHKNDFGLGKPLVIDFARDNMMDHVQEVYDIFSRKGAYQKFKALLEKTNNLDKCYSFETESVNKALRNWCSENKIDIQG